MYSGKAPDPSQVNFEAWFSRKKTNIAGAWLIFTNTSGKKWSSSEFLEISVWSFLYPSLFSLAQSVCIVLTHLSLSPTRSNNFFCSCMTSS
jgi:hypothetical protein